MNAPIRLGVLPDFAEECWASMDLCAEMLLARVGSTSGGRIVASRLCPPFRRRLTRLPVLGRRGMAFNVDRLLNRFRTFPRFARGISGDFDAFHVIDHTYSQLLHELPQGRAGVYCHDLDAFRCILEPEAEPRPRWFRKMAYRQLDGFRKAAVVFHSTAEVRSRIERFGLVDPSQLVLAPYGTSAEFVPTPKSLDSEPLPGLAGDVPFVMHVGSCIPRKRIDVLLDVFAGLRRSRLGLQLVQVGGEFTASQAAQIAGHGLRDMIMQVRGLSRGTIAALYRRAGVVLLTSEAEGFGLPLIEGLACGATVVASDIPVLREVGGGGAVYAPSGNVTAWIEVVKMVLNDPASAPSRAARLAAASRYSWDAHAMTIAHSYLRLLGQSS